MPEKLTAEQVLAGFKALYPNCFKAMQNTIALTKAAPDTIVVMVGSMLVTHSLREMETFEQAFDIVGPQESEAILHKVDDANGNPRYDL